jgi:hypothetical protein
VQEGEKLTLVVDRRRIAISSASSEQIGSFVRRIVTG